MASWPESESVIIGRCRDGGPDANVRKSLAASVLDFTKSLRVCIRHQSKLDFGQFRVGRRWLSERGAIDGSGKTWLVARTLGATRQKAKLSVRTCSIIGP